MVRLALLFGCTAARILPDGPLSMETLMAMNSEPNGVGLEMFLNGNKGAQEHLPLIMEMIKSNRNYEEAVDASGITGEAKDNVSSVKSMTQFDLASRRLTWHSWTHLQHQQLALLTSKNLKKKLRTHKKQPSSFWKTLPSLAKRLTRMSLPKRLVPMRASCHHHR